MKGELSTSISTPTLSPISDDEKDFLGTQDIVEMNPLSKFLSQLSELHSNYRSKRKLIPIKYIYKCIESYRNSDKDLNYLFERNPNDKDKTLLHYFVWVEKGKGLNQLVNELFGRTRNLTDHPLVKELGRKQADVERGKVPLLNPIEYALLHSNLGYAKLLVDTLLRLGLNNQYDIQLMCEIFRRIVQISLLGNPIFTDNGNRKDNCKILNYYLIKNLLERYKNKSITITIVALAINSNLVMPRESIVDSIAKTDGLLLQLILKFSNTHPETGLELLKQIEKPILKKLAYSTNKNGDPGFLVAMYELTKREAINLIFKDFLASHLDLKNIKNSKHDANILHIIFRKFEGLGCMFDALVSVCSTEDLFKLLTEKNKYGNTPLAAGIEFLANQLQIKAVKSARANSSSRRRLSNSRKFSPHTLKSLGRNLEQGIVRAIELYKDKICSCFLDEGGNTLLMLLILKNRILSDSMNVENILTKVIPYSKIKEKSELGAKTFKVAEEYRFDRELRDLIQKSSRSAIKAHHYFIPRKEYDELIKKFRVAEEDRDRYKQGRDRYRNKRDKLEKEVQHYRNQRNEAREQLQNLKERNKSQQEQLSESRKAFQVSQERSEHHQKQLSEAGIALQALQEANKRLQEQLKCEKRKNSELNIKLEEARKQNVEFVGNIKEKDFTIQQLEKALKESQAKLKEAAALNVTKDRQSKKRKTTKPLKQKYQKRRKLPSGNKPDHPSVVEVAVGKDRQNQNPNHGNFFPLPEAAQQKQPQQEKESQKTPINTSEVKKKSTVVEDQKFSYSNLPILKFTPTTFPPPRKKRSRFERNRSTKQKKKLTDKEKKAIGRKGEEIIYDRLRQYYKDKFTNPAFEENDEGFTVSGSHKKRGDAIFKFIWKNKEDESGHYYDMKLKKNFSNTGIIKKRIIEVKSTKSKKTARTYFSKDEIFTMRKHKNNYHVYRVFNVFGEERGEKPKIKKTKNLFEKIFNNEVGVFSMKLAL